MNPSFDRFLVERAQGKGAEVQIPQAGCLFSSLQKTGFLEEHRGTFGVRGLDCL